MWYLWSKGYEAQEGTKVPRHSLELQLSYSAWMWIQAMTVVCSELPDRRPHSLRTLIYRAFSFQELAYRRIYRYDSIDANIRKNRVIYVSLR